MLVLDENLPEGQRLWLRKWRFRFRVIGLVLHKSSPGQIHDPSDLKALCLGDADAWDHVA